MTAHLNRIPTFFFGGTPLSLQACSICKRPSGQLSSSVVFQCNHRPGGEPPTRQALFSRKRIMRELLESPLLLFVPDRYGQPLRSQRCSLNSRTALRALVKTVTTICSDIRFVSRFCWGFTISGSPSLRFVPLTDLGSCTAHASVDVRKEVRPVLTFRSRLLPIASAVPDIYCNRVGWRTEILAKAPNVG